MNSDSLPRNGLGDQILVGKGLAEPRHEIDYEVFAGRAVADGWVVAREIFLVNAVDFGIAPQLT